MIKELWTLIKLLFADIPNELECRAMKHFPFKGYKCMMWCGVAIFRGTKVDEEYLNTEIGKRTMRHETIHLKQAAAKGSWWKYYASYLWWWIMGNPLLHPAQSAYYTIPYEVEAFAKEEELGYEPTKESYKLFIIEERRDTYRKWRNDFRDWCKRNYKDIINK